MNRRIGFKLFPPLPFTLTATDANDCTGSRAYSLDITCPAITVNPADLPDGLAGRAYADLTFTQAGGVGTITYALTGTLPNGMTFVNGVLGGTPLEIGDYPLTVTATDVNGCEGSRNYTLTIECPVITPSPELLPTGIAGSAYAPVSFSQTGGVGAVTCDLTGALPDAMSFLNGVLSGTPLAIGDFPLTLTATDANGCAGSANYTLTILCPVITVNPPSVPQGTAGVPYPPIQFSQTGGLGTATFDYTGALPAGITLSPGGVLSGTPTETGDLPFTVVATDGLPCSGERSLTLTIVCPVITLPDVVFPEGLAGQDFGSFTLTAENGVGGYTFAVTGGDFPPGLMLSETGVLSGTPTAGGSFTFTVTATDVNGCAGSRSFAILIHAFDMTLYDDSGRSMVCINTLTGDWQWNYIDARLGYGSLEGTGFVRAQAGVLTLNSTAGTPWTVSLKVYLVSKLATGSLDYRAYRLRSSLNDLNFTNNPEVCDTP